MSERMTALEGNGETMTAAKDRYLSELAVGAFASGLFLLGLGSTSLAGGELMGDASIETMALSALIAVIGLALLVTSVLVPAHLRNRRQA